MCAHMACPYMVFYMYVHICNAYIISTSTFHVYFHKRTFHVYVYTVESRASLCMHIQRVNVWCCIRMSIYVMHMIRIYYTHAHVHICNKKMIYLTEADPCVRAWRVNTCCFICMSTHVIYTSYIFFLWTCPYINVHVIYITYMDLCVGAWRVNIWCFICMSTYVIHIKYIFYSVGHVHKCNVLMIDIMGWLRLVGSLKL